MLDDSDRMSAVLATEAGTASTPSQLLQYIGQIGMVHLNKNPASRSVGNVWDWSMGDPFAVLMAQMEARRLLLCQGLSRKRTFASPETGVALVQLAGERANGLSVETEQVYQLVRTDGPLTRREVADLCGHTTSSSRRIVDELVRRLLIAPFEDTRAAEANWPELSYWTVDEWLLNQGAAVPCASIEAAEDIVLPAAARCLMTDCPRTLARALDWTVQRADECLKRIGSEAMRDVHEPVRIRR